MMYHRVSFVLHAGQRTLDQLDRLPQVGHFIELSLDSSFQKALKPASVPGVLL